MGSSTSKDNGTVVGNESSESKVEYRIKVITLNSGEKQYTPQKKLDHEVQWRDLYIYVHTAYLFRPTTVYIFETMEEAMRLIEDDKKEEEDRWKKKTKELSYITL